LKKVRLLRCAYSRHGGITAAYEKYALFIRPCVPCIQAFLNSPHRRLKKVSLLRCAYSRHGGIIAAYEEYASFLMKSHALHPNPFEQPLITLKKTCLLRYAAFSFTVAYEKVRLIHSALRHAFGVFV
jgi:hypothetical protein